MTDATDLSHRLRFAAPEVRQRLGLPAYQVEDGRGGVAGSRPGFAYAPDEVTGFAKPRADDPRQRAFAAYVQRLTSAWRNP
jgi:hypothetical protein